MGKRDPRVDASIAKSAAFAKPILKYLRALAHEVCPEVEETLKWGSPTFMYHGMLFGIASFKRHAAVGFWKHALVVDEKDNRNAEAMGQFGRLTSVADLPSKRRLTAYIRKAMRLNEAGIKVERPRRAPRKPVTVPADLLAALAKNARARRTFAALSPGKRRDYVEWITEARADATRQRRLATTIEWLALGRSRNWKYENC